MGVCCYPRDIGIGQVDLSDFVNERWTNVRMRRLALLALVVHLFFHPDAVDTALGHLQGEEAICVYELQTLVTLREG